MVSMTATRAKSLKEPGLYRADPTLYLAVAPGGSKSWIQRLTINGKRHDIGLGGFPLVSLAEAREAAFANRKLARTGGDPLAEKRKAKLRREMPTFREAAVRTYEQRKRRWRNAKVAKNWMQQLERHAFQHLSELPVDEVGREEVLRVLTPIWTEKAETARRVRRYIRATLDWCQAHGYVEHNAAGDMINGALPSMPAVKSHFRALPYREAAAALETIEASRSSVAAKLALRFVVLTACRSGEVRGAKWDEIDLDERIWSIPGTRMKAGTGHRVPLSDAALSILEQAKALDDGSGLVFPSPLKPGRPLSDMTLTKMLRDTGLAERATVHGFRSTFRDWCGENGKARDVAEAALAHTVRGVEGAYFRSDLFERRRRLMEQWAAFVARGDATVVQLHG